MCVCSIFSIFFLTGQLAHTQKHPQCIDFFPLVIKEHGRKLKVYGRESTDTGMNLKVWWASRMRQCEGTPGAWEGREEQGQVGLLVGGFSGGGHAPGRNHMSSISIWHPPDYLLHFSGNSHPDLQAFWQLLLLVF